MKMLKINNTQILTQVYSRASMQERTTRLFSLSVEFLRMSLGQLPQLKRSQSINILGPISNIAKRSYVRSVMNGKEMHLLGKAVRNSRRHGMTHRLALCALPENKKEGSTVLIQGEV